MFHPFLKAGVFDPADGLLNVRGAGNRHYDFISLRNPGKYQSPLRARLYRFYRIPRSHEAVFQEKCGIRDGIIGGFPAGIIEAVFGSVPAAEGRRRRGLGHGGNRAEDLIIKFTAGKTCTDFHADKVRHPIPSHPLNTHTYTDLIMATKTISITEEAYERLKSLKTDEKTSFSDVIVKHYPKRKKLSEVLKELGDCTELADSVENVSREMRTAKLRKVEF